MFNRKNRTYTLNDIEKLFTRIPAVFILILAVLLTIITYFILDFKQKREVDLIQQKQIINYQFEKKDKLYNFVDFVNEKVNEQLSQVQKKITLTLYKTIGNIEQRSNSEFEFTDIYTYLDQIGTKNNFQIVLFQADNLSVLYGNNMIIKLEKMMFNSNEPKKFQNLILQYIYSQGGNNLQYWKYDQQKNLILSFFDIAYIQGKPYYLGIFSNINNIKSITRNMIISTLNSEELKSQDDFIWFYNSNDKTVFNYYNKQQFIPVHKITNKPQALQYYLNYDNIDPNHTIDTYLYNKFGYLLQINYDLKIAIINNIKQINTIKYKYKTLFYKIVITIIIFIVMLMLFSIFFTNFIKKIFGKYNKELSLKTQSLEHWKRRFELAIIASNDGLWDIDFKDDKIYFSNKWLSMFGYHKEDLTTLKDWFDLIHIDDIQEVKEKFEDIFQGKTDSLQCEYRLKTKNDGYKWVFARGKIFTEEQSNTKRMLMMSMDIDKNKKMIKELLDIEVLVEDGRMVIFKCNNDHNLSNRYISHSIKTYGYEKKDFETHILNFIDIVYDQDKPILNIAIQDAIRRKAKHFTKIFRITNAKGDIKWVFLRAILLKDYFENVTQIYGYFHDITKIKVSQDELKLKVKQEVEKNIKKDRLLVQQSKLASMGEMLENIAHQWRQPLNTVNLIIHYLRDNYQNDDFTKEKFEKYINKATTQIDYMSHTIDDFRNFYKPSKVANRFNIATIVQTVLEILNSQFDKQGVKIKLKLDDVFITGYENELKQALLNIVHNAKDAIVKRAEKEDFEPYIFIKIRKKKKFAKITIRNNGGIIEDKVMPRIFEPYFTTKFEKQGTGIGLYMSRIIIQTNMKGKIKVQNIKDGVEFTIHIPLDKQKKDK